MEDLIKIEQQNLMTVFSAGNGVDPILQKLKEEVSKFTPDMTTKKGREEIASMAYMVAKSKTYLDDLGKELTSEMKKQSALVDSSRRKIRDFCDDLENKVREPLIEWENKEKQRLENLQAKLSELRSFGNVTVNGIKLNLEQMKLRKEELFKIVVNSSWDEFESFASIVKTESLESITGEINDRQKFEDDQFVSLNEVERVANACHHHSYQQVYTQAQQDIKEDCNEGFEEWKKKILENHWAYTGNSRGRKEAWQAGKLSSMKELQDLKSDYESLDRNKKELERLASEYRKEIEDKEGEIAHLKSANERLEEARVCHLEDSEKFQEKYKAERNDVLYMDKKVLEEKEKYQEAVKDIDLLLLVASPVTRTGKEKIIQIRTKYGLNKEEK